MAQPEPQCSIRWCRHFRGMESFASPAQGTDNMVPVCPAFPRGIPRDIAYGATLHLTHDPRQEGDLTYDRIKPSEVSDLEEEIL